MNSDRKAAQRTVPSAARLATVADPSLEWSTEQLFGTAQEIGIRHQGHLYRLRRTKLGKLILTK